MDHCIRYYTVKEGTSFQIRMIFWRLLTFHCSLWCIGPLQKMRIRTVKNIWRSMKECWDTFARRELPSSTSVMHNDSHSRLYDGRESDDCRLITTFISNGKFRYIQTYSYRRHNTFTMILAFMICAQYPLIVLES